VGGLNVFYWTKRATRRGRVATQAVVVGTRWALSAWNVDDAYIRATTERSEKVAEKAGYKRTGILMKGAPLFRFQKQERPADPTTG
jgi:RimJ/RimL family protein N-acetyltransferase